MFPCIVAGPSSTASIDYHTYKGPEFFSPKRVSRETLKHFVRRFPMPQERRIESLTVRDSPIRPRDIVALKNCATWILTLLTLKVPPLPETRVGVALRKCILVGFV